MQICGKSTKQPYILTQMDDSHSPRLFSFSQSCLAISGYLANKIISCHYLSWKSPSLGQTGHNDLTRTDVVRCSKYLKVWKKNFDLVYCASSWIDRRMEFQAARLLLSQMHIFPKLSLAAVLSGGRIPLRWRSWVGTPGGDLKNFQNWLSSAKTHQPINCMRRKAIGCLLLSFTALMQLKTLDIPEWIGYVPDRQYYCCNMSASGSWSYKLNSSIETIKATQL